MAWQHLSSNTKLVKLYRQRVYSSLLVSHTQKALGSQVSLGVENEVKCPPGIDDQQLLAAFSQKPQEG
jgi:hypothetical protein